MYRSCRFLDWIEFFNFFFFLDYSEEERIIFREKMITRPFLMFL